MEGRVGLMKWFPLLFANVKTLFFTSTIFDNIAIWEDSSPAIFSHYKANYSWMSRQFPDNHWCCGDRHWFLLLSFFSADGSTFHSAVETESIAAFSQPGPIIPCLGPVEIQFHNQSVELGINKEWPIPSGLLLSPSYLLSFTRTSSSSSSFLSLSQWLKRAAAHPLFLSHFTSIGGSF